jgi:hypothetical protein
MTKRILALNGRRNRLEEGIVEAARARFETPVSHVVVD